MAKSDGEQSAIAALRSMAGMNADGGGRRRMWMGLVLFVFPVMAVISAFLESYGAFRRQGSAGCRSTDGPTDRRTKV